MGKFFLLALCLFSCRPVFAQEKKAPTIYDLLRDMNDELFRLTLHVDELQKKIESLESKTVPDGPYEAAIKQRNETQKEERLQNIEREIRDLKIKQQLQ